MVVASSSNQAKKLKEILDEKTTVKSALILHDVDDKSIRQDLIDKFKENNGIDILIVYNMLLTGFDAHRLKKLYLNREVKDHNLLQTLTRVNRPYKDFRYGVVVDFADIQNEFDKTNAEYFRELQGELGDEWKEYNNLFKSAEEIKAEIEEIQNNLFLFDTNNTQKFIDQINQIDKHDEILQLKKVLENAKVLGNLIRLYGYNDLANKLDFMQLGKLLNEVSLRLANINKRDATENDAENTNLINLALEDIFITFYKVGEKELNLGLVDKYAEMLKKAREGLLACFDKGDAVYISLYEELERLFKKKSFTEAKTPEELENDIIILKNISECIAEQNRRNNLLKAKYLNDEKFARIHKEIVRHKPPYAWAKREVAINSALLMIKETADTALLNKKELINNEPFFARNIMNPIYTAFESQSIDLDAQTASEICTLIVQEYINEYKGAVQK